MLVWYHVCSTAAQARQKERSLKNGRSRKKAIGLMIAEFPKEALAPFA
jgi:predicted GIY-YIG superfamily endonuclease